MSSSYNLGDYVQLSKKRKGYIRFEGKIPSVGDCFGVELDSKDSGGNDGSFGGEQYFDVKPGFGLFVKKSRIVSLIKKAKATSPPAISTTTTTSSSTTSSTTTSTNRTETKSPSKKKKKSSSKKKSSLSPRKNGKGSRREQMLKKKGRSATPRPRASTRDPRPMTLKQPQTKRTSTPKRSTTSNNNNNNNNNKQNKKTPTKYPKDGTNKEKLTFIFTNLSATTSTKKTTMGHKKSASEISKTKIDLIKKASLIIKELEDYEQDDSKIDNLITPSYIIKQFKKVFEPLLKDRKFAVHREILKLFNSLILCTFTRQSMSEQIIFSMKHLTNQLTNNNTKSVNAAKESIKLLIHEILYEDNIKLIKMIMTELLRYAKTSKKKIIRRNCWLFIVQILESKYNIKNNNNNNNNNKQEKEEKKEIDDNDDGTPEPSPYKNDDKNNSEHIIKKKNKPPKTMMDAISNGLKQGLNDSDKDVSIQAMRVLSLFSLLDETKADRLIAKMSTSTRKLFDSKYGPRDIGKGKKTKLKNGGKINGGKINGSRNKSPKKGGTKDGKPRKKTSGKSRRGGSGKGLFTLKEDPIKDDKKNKSGKRKKPSTKDKGSKNKGRTKSPRKKDKDGKKSPSKKDKDGKKSSIKTTEKNDIHKGKPKKKTEIPPLNTNDDDDDDESKNIEQMDYRLNEDHEDQEEEEERETTEVDMDKVRKARRQRRGGAKKTRSTGTFDGGNDIGVGFDLSALGGIVDGDHGDSGSDNDNDNDKSNESQMNAGMNGDVRKEDDNNDDYSSSTETYEGDNDIEIYEFPQKEALNNNKSPDRRDFNIDIDRYLSNNNAEYNWKFGNEEMIFFSHKNNTHLLMSRISQINKDEDNKDINYEDEEMLWINRLLEYPIDYNDLSIIRDTNEFWPTDIDASYSQILNPNLNNHNNGIITNGHGSDTDDALYDNPDLPPEEDNDDNNNNNDTLNDIDNNNNNNNNNKHPQHEFIVATQISYNLMRLLTNEHGSDWIKQFIEECIYEITVHALCVFHPLSNGNVYHGRVILEVLLNHFPRDFFKYLVEDSNIIQPLLKYAIFNNIHHGNLNSFVMDLICFDPDSIQQRDDIMFHEKSKMAQETSEYKQTLLNTIFCSDKWKFIESIMNRACSKYSDDISTKYSVFFVDLVARCASIENTKCLFKNCEDLIIDSFVNGLLGSQKIGKELNFWQRIRCGQSLVEYLDLASRPTIMDPSIAATPFGFMQSQNAYKENIFYPKFKYCLSSLINYIPDLCFMIIGNNDNQRNISPRKQVKFSYGDINKPLGRLKLNALELLTVTIDFHEMNCSLVLQEIPLIFWNKIVDMAFIHKNNNMFLCHFRRLIHLAMIFRRRILKYLCKECKLIDKMVDFYQTQTQRSELHGYILQMLNDIYCHDSEIKHIH